MVCAGNIRLDLVRFQTLVGDQPVQLTYQEFELLRLLMAERDRILPFSDIIENLWHGSPAGSRRRLGVVTCRLRAKLRAARPYQIHTVRGRGYGLTVLDVNEVGGEAAAEADESNRGGVTHGSV